MNYKQLQSTIAAKTKLPASKVDILLQSTIDAIIGQLKSGKSVSFQGFGSFEVKTKNERVVVSPTTKEKIKVPQKQVLTFKPSVTYKDKVKEMKHNEE